MNSLVHKVEILDSINCHSVAELMSAIESMGMSLDLAEVLRVSLIEETLSDGSKAQSVKIVESPQ